MLSTVYDNDNDNITSKRANEFLEAKGRNSVYSKLAYTSALKHLQTVIEDKYSLYNYDNIIDAILNKEVDVYELLNNFISYAMNRNIGPKSIKAYTSALKSYFAWHDVDIIPNKFKRRVTLPTINKVDEEAIEASDIRKILLACNNRRLKTYLLVLASGGMRAVEGLSIRNMDIDFSSSPTRLKIRADYSKTRTERFVYISDEATMQLQRWNEWKYKNPDRIRKFHNIDLVFTLSVSDSPKNLYVKVWQEFQKLLTIVKMDERKDESLLNRRHKVTIHSIRRFVYTTICDVADQAYAEWFLGHSKSVYHTKKEDSKREIYQNKIMKYLTFLDYSFLEKSNNSIESRLEEKEKEIMLLRKRDTDSADKITRLEENMNTLLQTLVSKGVLEPTKSKG